MPLIAGFLGAVKALPDLKVQYKKAADLNRYAREKLQSSGIAEINSPDSAVPFILNISVTGYRSETLLHFLERKNIFVSSGSACAKGELSYVLSALGLSKSRIDSALRISFSRDNSKEEIDLLLDSVKEAVTKLRRSDV